MSSSVNAAGDCAAGRSATAPASAVTPRRNYPRVRDDSKHCPAPGVVRDRTALARLHPGHPVDRYTLCGYTFGRLVVEGVARAGNVRTRERFVAAMEGIVNWDRGGVLPNVSFSATNHQAQRAGFICEMQGGRLVALTGSIAP